MPPPSPSPSPSSAAGFAGAGALGNASRLIVLRNVNLTYAGTVTGTLENGQPLVAQFDMLAPSGLLYNAISIQAMVRNNTWNTGVLELKQSNSTDTPFYAFSTPVQIAKTTLFASSTSVASRYCRVEVGTAEAVTDALDLFVFMARTS